MRQALPMQYGEIKHQCDLCQPIDRDQYAISFKTCSNQPRETQSVMIERHRTRIDKICQTVRQSNMVLGRNPTPAFRSSKRHGLWVRMAEKK